MIVELLLLISFFFTALLNFECYAWDLDHKTELQPSILFRKIPQKGFTTQDKSFDFFFRGSHLLRGHQGPWIWELKPEIYGFYGDSKSHSNSTINDPYSLSVKSTDRLLNLRSKLSPSDKLTDEWFLELERFNFSYNQDDIEISLGRKPVSLGILKIFPVWNKFSKPLPITTGPASILSSDSLSFRLQKDNVSYFLNSISESRGTEQIHFAGLIYYNNDIEFHTFLGKWWNQNTIGLALAKDFRGATWRFEGLLYEEKSLGDLDENLNLTHSQVGFGIEFAFNDKLSTLIELLKQSAGSNSKYKYLNLKNSHFRILKAENYNYLQILYKWSDLLTVSAAVLNNGVDGSRFDILKLQYSYSDNTELFSEVNLPSGVVYSEFSSRASVFSDGSYLGAPTQVSIGLKHIF